MVEYVKQYLNLVQQDYNVGGSCSMLWMLIELLFCLTIANGRVERAFLR